MAETSESSETRSGRTGRHALQRDGRAVHFGASNDDDVFEAHTVGVPQLLTELIALGVEHRRDVGAPESRRHRKRLPYVGWYASCNQRLASS